MTMTTHIYRAYAAEHARKQDWTGWRTQLDTNEMWKAVYEPGPKAAVAFAAANAVAAALPTLFTHGEVTWVAGATGDEDPHVVGVLVCKVPNHALDDHGTVTVDWTLARIWWSPAGSETKFLVEPNDKHRWHIFAPQVAAGAPVQPVRHDPREVHPGDRERPAPAAPAREPSTAGSPTKKVWEIADAMPGASRADVVAACVSAGINKNTAGTQYSHWKRSREAA